MDQTVETVPTIYHVARRAGVSIATVSRVLNGHVQISPAAEERVLAAVKDLGFVPNAAAQGLSKGAKKILGLVFANPWWQDDLTGLEETSLLFTDAVIRGAQWSADRHGYSLLLSSRLMGRNRSALFGDFIGKVDGLVLLDRVVPQERVGPISKRVPVVLLAGSGRSRTAVTVRVDNESAMRAVAEHLVVDHGLRRTAFVAGLADSPDNAARADAFEQAVAGLGGTCEPTDTLAADWTSSGAVQAVQARLDSGLPHPDVIVCANDQMAIGALHALTTAGLRVPDDVAVVGFDDIPVARYLSPTLTTVRQPSRELGAVAVDSLVSRLRGIAPRSRDLVLPTELILRQSCGCRTAPQLRMATQHAAAPAGARTA
ncbi:MAG: LacI family DNA-binding transcriptional regulator [Acidimicrobiales bacterium]